MRERFPVTENPLFIRQNSGNYVVNVARSGAGKVSARRDRLVIKDFV